MKLSVVSGALSLASMLACSANSGSEGSRTDGRGAASSTGATASNGASPSLSTGGGFSVDPNQGTAGGPDVQNGECAQQNFLLSSAPADVLLVLDRSKSMIEHDVEPGVNRWQAVVPALNQVVTGTDASVSWGLKMFPEGEGSECIATSVTAKIDSEIAPGNGATVTGIINATDALGNGTPTGEAILQGTAYLQKRGAANGRQFILLATDGVPSCPGGGDVARAYAVDAV